MGPWKVRTPPPRPLRCPSPARPPHAPPLCSWTCPETARHGFHAAELLACMMSMDSLELSGTGTDAGVTPTCWTAGAAL